MSWLLLAKALYDRAIADTGAGGLFNVADPLLSDFTTNEAPHNAELASLPYVVCQKVGEDEDNVFATAPEMLLIYFQFGVWTNKKRTPDPDEIHQAALDRLRTVFRRWQPTISGYTVSQIVPEGTPTEEISSDAIYSVQQYYCSMSR